jgi:hypothetical protein
MRSSYTVSVHGDVIALVGRGKGRSVTNDATAPPRAPDPDREPERWA